MAFFPLKYLKKGKYEFIYDLPECDKEILIEDIRCNENRINIINGFLYKAVLEMPYFCFEVIYDMEEYKEQALSLLEYKGNFRKLIRDSYRLTDILYNTSWGRNFVCDNLDEIIDNKEEYDFGAFATNDERLKIVLDYVFNDFDKNKDIIQKLSLHKNLHSRFIFMKYAIEKHPDKVYLIYDDILKYLTSYTHQENEQLTFLPTYMNEKDISELAIAIFNSKLDKKVWLEIKEYILSNYKGNYLSSGLLNSSSNYYLKQAEFVSDADRLFKSSLDYKLNIYHDYSKFISREIMEDFCKYLKYFACSGHFDDHLRTVISSGLWELLTSYVDKYLSLSKTDDFRYLGAGTTTSCYKIGDYAFKLNNMKWSYENPLCPNLYLILKNLEEIYIRDKRDIVIAGIEVQKYLSRPSSEITQEDLKMFTDHMKELGYYVNDNLVGGKYGDNCLFLDSYKDADCFNPELLPEDFKKRPLVLVDRDRVYRIGNKFPKQIS